MVSDCQQESQCGLVQWFLV